MFRDDVNIDYIGSEGAQGEMAGLAVNGRLNPGRMRPFIDPEDGRPYVTVYKGGDPLNTNNYEQRPITNATLRRDEWIKLDQAIRRVRDQRLRGVQILRSRDLVYNMGNAYGTTVLEHHEATGEIQAQVSMDGRSRGESNVPDYNTKYTPLPIVHADYEIDDRLLDNSRRLGNPIQTFQAERASRAVNETLEDFLFDASFKYTYGGGTIYSYLTHPSREKITGLVPWTDAAKTADQMVQDILDMIQAAIDNGSYGPWILYIPTAYQILLEKDYDNTRGNTIRERLLAIEGLEDVRVIDRMPSDNLVLHELTTETVRWVNGMGLQNIQWSTGDGFVHYFKVMAIQVPQIFADPEGRSGVIHYMT